MDDTFVLGNVIIIVLVMFIVEGMYTVSVNMS